MHHRDWILTRYASQIRAVLQRGLGGADIELEVHHRYLDRAGANDTGIAGAADEPPTRGRRGAALQVSAAGAKTRATDIEGGRGAADIEDGPAIALRTDCVVPPDPEHVSVIAEHIADAWCEAMRARTGRFEHRRPSGTARAGMAQLGRDLLGRDRSVDQVAVRAAFEVLFGRYLQLHAADRAFPSVSRVQTPHAGHGVRWCLDRLDEVADEVSLHQQARAANLSVETVRVDRLNADQEPW